MAKRIVIISDLHCGARSGLTPPGWQSPEDSGDHEIETFARNQRITWEWFSRRIESLRPIDYLFINGDAIDGKGERTGGTEQIQADRNKQVEMATAIIQFIESPKIVMTYGTAYHTGREEDFEYTLAGKVNADKIGGHEWVDVNGLVFDLKHKVGSSQIPHGRYTAVAREALWNLVWSAHDGQPRADVVVRSHVHYFAHCGNADSLALTTPALQGWGSKFGVRECAGTVDIGFLHFDVQEGGKYTWEAHLLKPMENAAADMILKL
jgi:hypothetical protein